MEPPKKKRKVLTLEEKANIIRAVASGRKKCDVAAEHGIPASTLSTILKTKDAIILATSSGNGSKKKNLKTTPHEKLEEALFMWFNDMRARNVPLSGEVVQQKALNYACLLGFDEFKASPGWLSRFKERYGIVGKVSSGESSSVNKQGVDEWLSENVPEILGRYAKLLLNLEIKRETKIDVYMAIEMVAASWRATRSSIVVNCFRHAGFHTSTSEAASGSTSPQHEQEEASPSCWEELRRRDQVAADQDFDDFVNADTDANTDTTEVLDDEEIVQLVSGAQEKSDEAKGPDAIEAPVPTPSQVMDAVDLLRRFAGAHEGAEDALTSLASYEKCVRPLLTKRAQAKITSFFH
ncbi:tigger transposable element-derived protein 6-like [Ixodes scapularis]